MAVRTLFLITISYCIYNYTYTYLATYSCVDSLALLDTAAAAAFKPDLLAESLCLEQLNPSKVLCIKSTLFMIHHKETFDGRAMVGHRHM